VYTVCFRLDTFLVIKLRTVELSYTETIIFSKSSSPISGISPWLDICSAFSRL